MTPDTRDQQAVIEQQAEMLRAFADKISRFWSPLALDMQNNEQFAAALRAGAQALRSQDQGWMPIESALKDGTNILLGWPAVTGDGLVLSGYWANWQGRKAWVTSRGEYHGDYAPTHWMPLPAPPTGDSR